MYRAYVNYFTVRTCSTYHGSGGTIHSVTTGYYHGSYSTSTTDYDVAVLKVCTEFNMPIDSAMCVMCLLWYFALCLFRLFGNFSKSEFNFIMSVRLCVWMGKSAPTGRIFLEINRCGFLKNL